MNVGILITGRLLPPICVYLDRSYHSIQAVSSIVRW